MSLLSRVQTQVPIKPPRIVIHGPGGVGKTTFGASTSKPIVFPFEEGEGIIQVPRLPRPSDYEEVMSTFDELLKADHDYRTLVLDTVDYLEPLVWAKVCRAHTTSKNKYSHIEDFGFGKGYLYADPYWTEVFRSLDALRRERSMMILVLSHNTVAEIKDPNLGPYHKIEPKLHKRANALMYEWADVVGFLDIERVAIDREASVNGKGPKIRTATTTGLRVLYLEDQGSFRAKNRFDLPPSIEIPKDSPFSALRNEILKRIQPQAQENPDGPSES